MNGFSSDMRIIRFQPEWEYYLGAITKVINIAIIPVGIFYVAMELWVGMRRRWF